MKNERTIFKEIAVIFLIKFKEFWGDIFFFFFLILINDFLKPSIMNNKNESLTTRCFYKKIFYNKMSLRNPKTLKGL